MFKLKKIAYYAISGICIIAAGCKIPAVTQSAGMRPGPASYNTSMDTLNAAATNWRSFFKDKYLNGLIDTALNNNQELLITLQDIELARNDIRIRKGAMLPTVGLRTGIGVDKVGRYTSQGAGDASTEIAPGKEVPEALMDYSVAAVANWEVDIWKKLSNAKQAAVKRYLSTIEGKNFVLSNLVAEVANSYYELEALDNQLDIVRQTITLQKQALEVVKLQKNASRATELGVQKFEAEVLGSQSREFDLLQQIKETENRINFLLGRYPQEIPRDKASFMAGVPTLINFGVPAQMLENRPDIRQAEFELAAAKLDVSAARKEFYPSLNISAAVGIQAYNPSYLVKLPSSILWNLAGELTAPLINRNAIKAEYFNANARQQQALYNYQRTVLNAYMEVSTELSRIDNLEKSYDLKSRQVGALTRSIDIANDLFKFARADYFEVLMTQRDALDSKLEMVETRKAQLVATSNIYKYLGGGWR
ncbi:TolC family protein [Mucilaginibacter calamicampi]|uniref:TolC family protein n=1 Tax=Mucilaginibacter calamicampi TaxID=1302352 RepID=A0ABW2Z1K1_9SPHI